METFETVFFNLIGIIITIPFLFLCYKFHQYNQYKEVSSWTRMIGWLMVIITYWSLYLSK